MVLAVYNQSAVQELILHKMNQNNNLLDFRQLLGSDPFKTQTQSRWIFLMCDIM